MEFLPAVGEVEDGTGISSITTSPSPSASSLGATGAGSAAGREGGSGKSLSVLRRFASASAGSPLPLPPPESPPLLLPLGPDQSLDLSRQGARLALFGDLEPRLKLGIITDLLLDPFEVLL